jgi:hypothetical protein
MKYIQKSSMQQCIRPTHRFEAWHPPDGGFDHPLSPLLPWEAEVGPGDGYPGTTCNKEWGGVSSVMNPKMRLPFFPQSAHYKIPCSKHTFFPKSAQLAK